MRVVTKITAEGRKGKGKGNGGGYTKGEPKGGAEGEGGENKWLNFYMICDN